MTIAVIGAGASGMMAALTAAETPENKILLFERQARVGRKLAVTGNGRCNLTNRDMALSHYHGTAPQFCLPALEAFGVEQTLAWFRSMGLLTVTEPGGRVYPASDSANSVADVLRLTLAGRQNVTLHAGCEITELRRTKGGFSVRLGDESCLFDRVIVCAGGAAGGKALHAGAYLVDVLDVAHVQTDHAHAAGGAHHQPLLLQAAQGLADGRAADAELFAELGFGQDLAARVDAGEDVLFENFKHLVGDGNRPVFHALTSLPSSKARR